MCQLVGLSWLLVLLWEQEQRENGSIEWIDLVPS